ncbi:MAG: response regulator [Nitrospinae bacterium]|nr:response regulator [Nitrospinota bacterium]
MDANGQADEVRRLEKETQRLKLKLAVSEQARERLENHLDKHNSLFKANIQDLDAVIADREKQIAERKLAEEIKQEALSRLQNIARLVPGIVFQFRLRPDGSSCVPYASDAIRDIYRISPEEVREDASKVFSVVHPDDLDVHLASIQASARDLTPWKQEYRLKFGDEPALWLFGSAIPQREADGSTLWHGFISDITERRTIEEITPDIFYTIDLKGNLQRWNRSFEKLCGLSPDRMKGRLCLDFIYEEDRPIVAGDIQKVLTEGSALNTYRFIRSDGALVPFHCNATLILNALGEPSGFAGFGRDISKLQEKENLLHAAKEQAESATRLKDKFVMLVSHDLRSPIAMIPSALNILREQLADKLDEPQLKLLDKSIVNCERLIEMIDQLLDISRLQTGTVKPFLRFIDANALARQIVETLSPLAERKGVALINAIKEKTRIYADYQLICEVISNLATNAIKFTRAGDTITIFSPEDNPSAIAVKDTGMGIAPHILPNLFHHEIKTTTTGTAGELGTGLGLPFCKDIMDAHRGTITVESERGKGSVFYAMLPARAPVALVVEDDPLQLEIISWHVKEAGFTVVEAGSGLEALDRIMTERPDVMITDIKMPGMDGIELLTRFKEVFGGKPPPSIALTGSKDKLVLERAFYAGAADVVNKPIDENELIPRLNRLLMMEPT